MYIHTNATHTHTLLNEIFVKRYTDELSLFFMCTGQFAENETNEVNFREIPSHVLSKVCMYFTYKVRYTNSSTEIPEFPIAPEIALELLMAANFLDC
uniref:Elongin-C n=1 Tax=Laticauda laticaudata TaxID=8630 RepID=A0A8C5S900_LATLA